MFANGVLASYHCTYAKMWVKVKGVYKRKWKVKGG